MLQYFLNPIVLEDMEPENKSDTKIALPLGSVTTTDCIIVDNTDFGILICLLLVQSICARQNHLSIALDFFFIITSLCGRYYKIPMSGTFNE